MAEGVKTANLSTHMKNGNKGCNKNENCIYLHPEMCNKTLRGEHCNSCKCSTGHFEGTFTAAPQKNSKIANSQLDFQKSSAKGPKFKKTPTHPPPPRRTTSSNSSTNTLTPLPQHQPTPTIQPPLQGLDTMISSIQALQIQIQAFKTERDSENQNMWTFIRNNIPNPPHIPPTPPQSNHKPNHHTPHTHTQHIHSNSQPKPPSPSNICSNSQTSPTPPLNPFNTMV